MEEGPFELVGEEFVLEVYVEGDDAAVGVVGVEIVGGEGGGCGGGGVC